MTIEQRITAALRNQTITAVALAELIVDTSAAIEAAELAAETARKRALDPTRSPDPAQARQAMEDAEFAVQRLRSMRPRLQQRYERVADHEEYQSWAAQFDPLVPKHKAAAERLRAIYQQVVAELIPALAEARAVDAEVHRVANLKPYYNWNSNNDNRTLPTVEAAARGLSGVNPDYSLMQLKLPAFDEPNRLVWPPPEVPLAVQVAASMVSVGDPRLYTAEWWKVQAERAAAARAQAQREHQERQAKADAAFNGPRWWEKETA